MLVDVQYIKLLNCVKLVVYSQQFISDSEPEILSYCIQWWRDIFGHVLGCLEVQYCQNFSLGWLFWTFNQNGKTDTEFLTGVVGI